MVRLVVVAGLLITALAQQAPPTWSRDVAPIVHRHCAPCHRPGETAPFALLSHDDAADHAAQIAEATAKGVMPPWLAAPSDPPFVGERRLTAGEIDTLARWAAAGAPRGDPQAEPAPPTFPSGWRLGSPELIVEMPESYTLAPEGRDIYRNFVLPVPGDRLRYVKAVEFRPGNARVVHHAVIKLDRTDDSRRLDAKDPEPGFPEMERGQAASPDGHFVGWTPGRTPSPLPDGMAWRLPPGADLIVQLHLMPSGRPEPVRASIGLYFTDQPPSQQPLQLRLGSQALEIPAGATDHDVRDEFELPIDVEIAALAPHAHFLGRSVDVQAELPDGSRRPLLSIPDWNFSWQDEFRYVTPVTLPRGTRLQVHWRFDNSEANPRNPHRPPEPVHFGPSSLEEMCDVWIQALPRGREDFTTLARATNAHELDVLRAGFELAVRRDPGDGEARLDLALTLLAQGDEEGAVRELRLTVAADSRLAQAWTNLGILLARRGGVAEARASYEKALALEPDQATAMHGLGALAEEAGDRTAAAAWYERAVAARPSLVAARTDAARLQRARGADAAAVGHLRALLELGPGPTTARELAWLLATSHDDAVRDGKRAVELARDLVAQGREDALALDTLAAAQAEAGRMKAALETVARALEAARRGGNDALVTAIEARAALYRTGKPWHDPPPASVSR